jgi:hypothetical protein
MHISWVLTNWLCSFFCCILQGRNLILGNLGDSRAVLCTKNENNELVAVQLTVDLKPNIPSKFYIFLFLILLIFECCVNLWTFANLVLCNTTVQFWALMLCTGLYSGTLLFALQLP